ncbi:hypothetical protein ACC691_36755, partial [Rhizobium johnstonii]|uniref:hypothetical protein n=1 Tax=Rhizobium johnstonii TaxID=3019933 RepID=UPI003F9E19EA
RSTMPPLPGPCDFTSSFAIDNEFFSGTNKLDDIQVEFSDGVQESQKRLAEAVQLMYTSESASVKERVTMLHPDWDDEQIDEEVKLIQAEFAHADPMADPNMDAFGTPGAGNGIDPAAP